MKRVVLAIVAALFCTAPAAGRECALRRAVFEPLEGRGRYEMTVQRTGHSYAFTYVSKPLRRTTRFIGSFQNGTGHLILEEDGEGDRQGISSRAVLFRADLTTTDPWSRGSIPVAYAYFEGFALAFWDRARSDAEDDKPGSSPPDGLWRIARCRKA
ncbi:MAG TPA: hypothetical protein VER17_20950 [Tepidisphaeraceae bacterium]|nr:hypothetical protein [Tepidisphaeraceae bacterium]